MFETRSQISSNKGTPPFQYDGRTLEGQKQGDKVNKTLDHPCIANRKHSVEPQKQKKPRRQDSATTDIITGMLLCACRLGERPMRKDSIYTFSDLRSSGRTQLALCSCQWWRWHSYAESAMGFKYRLGRLWMLLPRRNSRQHGILRTGPGHVRYHF